MKHWHAELAWLGDLVERDVLITVDGDRIVEVTARADAPAGSHRIRGLLLPGLVNAHSHAFQRVLRGRTHAGAGDFWVWRRRMYEVAERVDPDSMYVLALGTYCEMAHAGITTVGEFHYLHHGPGGKPYEDSNAMGEALLAAAQQAGIRLTLLETCYLQGGIDGAPLEGAQRRFGDGSVDAWATRADRLADGPHRKIGAAIHSVRGVPPDAMREVALWAYRRGRPLHAHVSEQPAENEECRAVTGLSPTAVMEREGVVGAGFTAVHATHADDADIALLGAAGSSVCVCPTTERDLGDGVTPAAALAAAGARLCFGSDSNGVIDLFEEARASELDQRLVTGRRGIHPPAELMRAATLGGAEALGWEVGQLAAGRLADFAAVSLSTRRTTGTGREDAVGSAIFAAAAEDVTDVVVGGEVIVRHGHHLKVPDWPARLSRAVDRLWSS